MEEKIKVNNCNNCAMMNVLGSHYAGTYVHCARHANRPEGNVCMHHKVGCDVCANMIDSTIPIRYYHTKADYYYEGVAHCERCLLRVLEKSGEIKISKHIVYKYYKQGKYMGSSEDVCYVDYLDEIDGVEELYNAYV